MPSFSSPCVQNRISKERAVRAGVSGRSSEINDSSRCGLSISPPISHFLNPLLSPSVLQPWRSFSRRIQVLLCSSEYSAPIYQNRLGKHWCYTPHLSVSRLESLLLVHVPTTWSLRLAHWHGMRDRTWIRIPYPLPPSFTIEIADAETRGNVVTFYALVFDVGFLIGAPL